MDDTPKDAAVSSEAVTVRKEGTNVPAEANFGLPELIPIFKINRGHNEGMPLLDDPPLPVESASSLEAIETAKEIVTELAESSVKIENTVDIVESTTEIESITETTKAAPEVVENSPEVPEITTGELVPENTPEKESLEVSETTNIEENLEPKCNNSEDVLTSAEFVAPNGESNENNVTESEEQNISPGAENAEQHIAIVLESSEQNISTNTIEDSQFEVTELTEYNVEEVAIQQNTSGDAIEAENAVAQIITLDEAPGEAAVEEQVHPEVAKADDDVLIENDNNFPTEQTQGKDSEPSTENAEVEYHIILNDNPIETVSVNGIPQLTKEEVVAFETEIAVKTDDNHTFESEVQNPVMLSLPSDTVTEEVTFTDVQMLETHEGVVTISELNEQPQEEVVILEEEGMLLMEAEEYDHPESIKINAPADDEASNVPNQEQMEEEDDDENDLSKPLKIPCHVLGRNIDNPLEDPVRNGRILMKPRLGVKVPYRNLTSQIVSKQDIANEIMERSRLRQSTAEPPAGGDVFFAKKLTQRLAKKLISPTKSEPKSAVPTSSSSSSSSKKIAGSSHRSELSAKPPKQQLPAVSISKVHVSPAVTPKPNNASNNQPLLANTSDKITNNSDLIALLEGDDDTDWTTLCPKKSDASTSNKSDPQKKSDKAPSKKSMDWERETALKQLRELPNKASRDHAKLVGSSKSSEPVPKQSASNEPSQADLVESVPLRDPLELDPLDELKDDLNSEPRFSSSLVMKTYTRKRKPEDNRPNLASATIIHPPKKLIVLSDQKSGTQKQHVDENAPKAVSTSSPKHPLPKTPSQKSSSTPNSSKAATPAGQKSVQKSSSSKPSTVPKTASTPNTTQKASSNPQKTSSSSVQKTPSAPAQKAPSNPVQKTSSNPKTPSSPGQKAPSDQKPPSTPAQKTSASEKKQPAPEKKQPESEKKQPASEKKQPQPTSTTIEKKRPITPPPEKSAESAEVSVPKKTLSPNTYISKSSRIVKRKKIWDPDEATPTFKASPALKSPKPQDVPKTANPEKAAEKKTGKQATVLKPSNDKAPPKTAEQVERESPAAKMVEKKVAKLAILKPNNEKSPMKKVLVKKVLMKKKKLKRLTEVDRLLMDEGAVNLLYSVKNTEELQNLRKKKRKTTISLDRAQKELLNKTNEIKNDLQINSTKDSPISLRKKEGGTPKTSPAKMDLAAAILQRKKSKDSVAGSVHSPPASPGYAYSQHAEASRIIRRHSSSSFSSDNMEDDENEATTEKSTKHKATNSESPKKKLKVSHEKQPGSRAAAIGVVEKQLLNEEMSKNFNKSPPEDPKYSEFETFSVRKFDNLVQLILASTSANGHTTLSVQVLTELTTILDLLQKDSSCRVVLVSSSGNSFCQGIDYKELVCDDENQCQSMAEQFATSIREFLTSLSKFSKILVAGVHGNTVGVGVTMLPLFDMVLASDTATFSTPYARLGCAAEGGVLLTLPHVMHNALASELFFASRKLTAAEALRLGLVTRTLWPDKFQEELISALKIISGQSLQSMQAIKKQLRHHLLQDVESSLKSESETLIRHWMSNECQSNFSNYSVENK